MQAFLGTILFVIICVVALVVAIARNAETPGGMRFVLIPAQFAGIVVAVYCGMAIIAGVLWLVAWIGIYLRYIALWLIGMALHPWNWIVS